MNAELTPFQYKGDVKPGLEWTIVTLDFNLAQMGDTPLTKAVRVRCTENTTIIMYGVPTRAFVVSSGFDAPPGLSKVTATH